MFKDDHFHQATAFAVTTGTAISTMDELKSFAAKVVVSVLVGLVSAACTKLMSKLSQKFFK